ncbi:MAG: NAD(P)-dependent oxidoreductase [Alphaproteobacteria bacterium]|nr:NAD(P)-dependent oxidoreductase [Alphaproteobacteria bacterium]
MTDSKLTIGWIGAGKMGLPIARRLKVAGHAVQVLARTAQSNEKLKAAELDTKPSIAGVCQNADIVFSSISDDAALFDIVNAKGGIADSLSKKCIYVDMSTVSPEASAKVGERLQKAGIIYLRSPVSGSTIMAEAGTLTAIVSGPKAAFESLQSVFTTFSRKCFHVGEAEEARTMKLALNSMVAATSALLAEALAFGFKGGLELETMLNVINQSVVASPLIAYKTDMIVKNNYKPAATLSMLQKDVDLLLNTAAAQHVALPLNTLIHQIYRKAAVSGLAEQDFFVLVQDALKSST